MSKKIAVLSVVMLVLGGVAIPGGFFVNNIIDSMVTDRVDDGLLGIQEQFIPTAEDMILEMGPAIALPLIQEKALPIIEEMVSRMGPAIALNLIRENSLPIIEEMVHQIGVAIALEMIQEEAVPIIEQEINKIGPAIALQIIKEIAVPASYELLYASFLTQLLYNAYEKGEERTTLGISGGDCLLNMFFDKVEVDLGTLGGGTSSFSAELKDAGIPNAGGQYILGISQWNGANLDIGTYSTSGIWPITLPNPNPNDRLAWGQSNPIWPNSAFKEVNNPPGFMQHTEKGFGILQYLENFTKAQEIGTQAARDAFCNPYEEGGRDIPFSKMEVVHDYFYEYWIPVAMPLLLADLQDPTTEFAQYAQEYIGMELNDIAYYEFLKQWTSYSTYSQGADFHNFVESLPPGTRGLEVDSPTISINSLYDLWDEYNEWSFLNITGIKKWYDAYSDGQDKQDLQDYFSLSSQEAQDILDWLWGPGGFTEELFPQLTQAPEPFGYGATVEELSWRAFYELWANGTALGLSLYPDGMDFGEFMPDEFPIGTTGFEVGVPTPTGMSLELIEALWDETNDYSLTNIDGIKVWFRAYTSQEDKDEVLNEFSSLGLDNAMMDMILDWLWDGPTSFSQGLLPTLIDSNLGFGMEIPDLAKVILYELWANGTALGLNLFPGGMDFGEFMPDEFPIGTTGFEIGVPLPTGMTIESVEALWDENNEYSLLNMNGMGLWLEAYTDDDMKATLMNTFNLSPEQAQMILDWLWDGPTSFSQGLLPTLIESDMGIGAPLSELPEILLYELWANGTAMGLVLYPGGMDFGVFMPDYFPIGTTGFEVGSKTPTGLSIDQIEALWDQYNEYSLTNMTGIERWLEAFTDGDVKATLNSIFDLTVDQTQMILDWLWDGPTSFSQGLLPTLLESELGYNMTLKEFAKVLMLEQWANGTIMGMIMFEGGIDFHNFISSLPKGSTGFEVGVPVPTNMSIESALLLWDTSNPYSLVKDISVWWNIGASGSTRYNTTRDANLLDDVTMDMILEWLPRFKNDLMPVLAQYEMGLPMDTTALGSTIQIGGMIVGAIAIGLASTGLVSNRIVSRKIKYRGKGDKTTKKFDRIINGLNSVSQELNEGIDSENKPFSTRELPSDD